MKLNQLETPALIVDADAMERNIDRMMKRLEGTNIKLRPHFKSFKNTVIAHKLIQKGAVGITVAKLSEAEDLIDAGIDNVLIANQITDPAKIMRLSYLADCCHLTVCVDSLENIRRLEAACAVKNSMLYCLIEYDIGMNRCGVFTEEEFIGLAKEIESSPHLHFSGVQAYAGNLAHEESFEKRKSESDLVEVKLRGLLNVCRENHLSVETVSGISTGTCAFHGKDSVYTELQAGSFLFADKSYQDVGVDFEQSLYLLTSVISRRPGVIITDAGVKSLGMDQKNPYFKDYPDVPVEFSEEHMGLYIETERAVGDRLLVVPGHCCTTINVFDKLYLVRNGIVEDRILLTGRGRSL